MIGQSFGNYRVTGLIGEGGMGVVYAAEHPGIGRRAAVKILRHGLTENAEITRRFFNEARAANAIRHPSIVEVFDSGTLPSGVSYIVMEFLEGESLAGRLKRVERLSADEARGLAAQTASALAAAHDAGIVHRDLKPDNLFLVPDPRNPEAELVKVLDFGIAKLATDGAGSSVRTRTGAIMGTPAYMSPEQCRGTKEVDHRTDIYALGVILYEMVCGRPPFVSEGFGEMVHLHISQPPPPPRTLIPGLPVDLETIIISCLAKSPDERTQTMRDLYRALVGKTMPGLAKPAARREPPAQAMAPTEAPSPQKTTFTQAALAVDPTDQPRRSRRGLVVSALVVAGVAVGGAQLWRQRTGGTPEPTRTSPVTAPPVAAPLPPPSPPPAPTVTAAISSEPAGARVVRERDGAVIGTTPFRERWPSGGGVQKLRLELDGYQPEAVAVPLDRGVELSFALRKLPEPTAPRTKPGRHHAAPPKAAAPKPAGPKPPSTLEPVPL
jgi:tRNA A-37 threonylcarbamoyl transferase component Bud32